MKARGIELYTKKKAILNIYSHNAIFDTNCYFDFTDTNITFFCDRPFIAAYKYNGKEIIKFLDSLAIFKTALKDVGELIDMPKWETPEELLITDDREIGQELILKISKYCERDTLIVQKAMLYYKDMLKKNGIRLKRLYTIGQIAINVITNEIRKMGDTSTFMFDKDRGMFLRNRNTEEIHQAYRGGRVQAFKTGYFKDVNYYDVNSLYPYCAINMEFPDLRTERRIQNPLQITDQKELFNKIGISKVMFKNTTSKLGVLPVRTKSCSYFPGVSKWGIGVYTHIEIRKAIEEGYEIKDVEYSVVWDKGRNPFRTIFTDLYRKRMEAETNFESKFFKNVMNHSIGKFAQTSKTYEMVIDSVEKAEEYLKDNYEIIRGMDLEYMYRKVDNKADDDKWWLKKKYYCPIIPTLITAYSRCYMYDLYKQVPQELLLYSDTDSVVFQGDSPFIHSSELGKLKMEHHKADCRIYGLKTYRIAKDIKVAGFRKKEDQYEDFEKGTITSKKMVTKNNARSIEDIGTFTDEVRDLHKQEVEHRKSMALFEEQDVYVDDRVKNIEFFKKHLVKIFA